MCITVGALTNIYFFVIEGKRLLVPDGCDLVAAGAMPVAFGTSHVALVHRAQLKPGQVCFHINMDSVIQNYKYIIIASALDS